MKLSEWARQQGVSYKTAWRWFHAGQLPVPARQLSSGTILVEVPDARADTTVIYGRVSSADQKEDLDRQVARLTQFATEKSLSVQRVITEIGSGLNSKRPKLIRLLADPQVRIIVVEHEDRLMRFGFEYVEAALVAQGRRILVADPEEMKDDLVQDMIDVLTAFCARLYGRRSARNRAQKAMEAMQHAD